MQRLSAAVAALVVALAVTPGRAHDASACTWSTYGHDAGHSFAQSADCSEINATNVETLRLKWFFKTPAPVTAPPVVDVGTVYVGSAEGVFYAFPRDAATPNVEPRWTFNVNDATANSYGKILSSGALVDIGGRHIVAFSGGATVYLLDATNGALLGSMCVDPRPGGNCGPSEDIIEITSSPTIVERNGEWRLYTGMDFNEGSLGRAGMIAARIDASTFAVTPLWKFDPERQLVYTTDVSKDGVSGFEYSATPLTHGGRGHGCGNVWSSAMLSADRIFFATANCSPGRLGDSTEWGPESIWSIDADTGDLQWCYAPRPVNGDDLDFGASPNLLPNGLIGEGGKDGFYYAMRALHDGPVDRRCATHTPAWKANVTVGFAYGGIIGTPALGMSGGKAAIFITSAIPVPDEGAFSDPGRMFAVHAVDASNGEILWHAPMPGPSYGAPVYTNGVVFVPDTFTFSMQAYSADLGVPLWSFPLVGAPSSGPAVLGDSIYFGAGTSVDPVPLGQAAGIYALQLAA